MAKGKVPTADDVMPMAGIKSVLRQVKKDGEKEIGCAVCMTGDKADAVIVVDRKLKPKGVRKMLIADAKKAGLDIDQGGLRFGTAGLSPDDETVLLITVNKAPSGSALHVKVKARVKPAGFSDVIFSVDETLDAAPEDDAAAAGAQAAAPGAAAPPPAPPPPPPPAPGAAGTADAAQQGAQLQRLLATLIPRIPVVAGTNAAVLKELGDLARDASAKIKASDLPGAGKDIATLRTRLDAGPAAAQAATGAAAAAPASGDVFGKLQAAWHAAHGQMEADVAKLRAEIVAAYKADGLDGELSGRFDKLVGPLVEKFNGALSEKIGAVSQAPDAATRAQRIAEAKELAAAHQTALSDPLIADLDNNPFVPLTIGPTLTKTLGAIVASMR